MNYQNSIFLYRKAWNIKQTVSMDSSTFELVNFQLGRSVGGCPLKNWLTTYSCQVFAKFWAHQPVFGSSLQFGNLQQTERLSKCQLWTMWSNWRKWNIWIACDDGKFKRATQGLETVNPLTWKFLFNCKCHVVG